jgi:hypothetical protein
VLERFRLADALIRVARDVQDQGHDALVNLSILLGPSSEVGKGSLLERDFHCKSAQSTVTRLRCCRTFSIASKRARFAGLDSR